jgi:ubiquinone/menaquinone biosynthesis C-methylase UbiE
MENSDLQAAEERVRQEFNQWAEAGHGEGMEEEHATIAAGMVAQMTFEERDKILDIGCGAGWFSALLAARVPTGQVVGMDVADDMIRLARKNYVGLGNAMFLSAAAEEIPWDEDFFNKVVSIESAYYWPDPAQGFREVLRVLQPGGMVWILINLFKENKESHQWQEKLEVPTHLLSGEEWCDLLEQAGFQETCHSFVPDPRPVPDDRQSRWFRDAESLRKFRQIGALLVVGTKPSMTT